MVNIYELTVSKIRCTNCAKKIKASLEPQPGVQDVKVNVLAEKVIVTFDPALITLLKIEEALMQSNFKIVGMPNQIQLDATQARKAQFLFLDKYFWQKRGVIDEIANVLRCDFKAGIEECNVIDSTIKHNDYKGTFLVVVYQPEIVKGRTIYDTICTKLEQFVPSNGEKNEFQHDLLINNRSIEDMVMVYDQILEGFRHQNNVVEGVSIRKLFLAFLITVIYVFFVMIFPQIEGFDAISTHPMQNGMFSYYLIGGLLITIITMVLFGRKCYSNAVDNYRKHRLFNMDSLVTLGSISAFIMSLLLLVVYHIQTHTTTTMTPEMLQMDRSMQIMNVIHMFESTALILTVITIGKYFEGKAKRTILTMQQKIFPSDQLLRTTHYTYLEPKNQKFMIDSQKEYEVSLLERGDLIKLAGGMKLLCDGVILKGEVKQWVVDSICYGWDDPFTAQAGTRLKSGADIMEGECYLQIENPLEGSMLFQIAQQLDLTSSQNDSSEGGITGLFQSLSDHFVKGVIVVALLVLVVWLVLVALDVVLINQYCVWCFPFERAISILVASCPCALGLAVPSVIVITLNIALQHGILIKKNIIFEQISKVEHVLFDKTGTLFTKVDQIQSFKMLNIVDITSPEFVEQKEDYSFNASCPNDSQIDLEFPAPEEKILKVKEQVEQETNYYQVIEVISSLSADDIWGIVAIMEKDSKHPLGLLLYKEAIKRSVARVATFAISGQKPTFRKMGIEAEVVRTDQSCPGFKVLIGNVNMMVEHKVAIDPDTISEVRQLEEIGKTVLLVSLCGKAVLQISLDNKSNLRPEAKKVVKYLRQVLKKQIYILSGDSKKTVQDVGNFLEIPEENLLGEMDADQKRNLLKQKKSRGSEAMMIGDGLNDVLSLREAGVGVSINAKSELNLMAADVIILSENLWKIPILFNLMNLANKVVHINLVWAFAYNIFITRTLSHDHHVAFAAGIFYPLGFAISPMISSAAMSISSIIVVLISNTMRCVNIVPPVRHHRNSVVDVTELNLISS